MTSPNDASPLPGTAARLDDHRVIRPMVRDLLAAVDCIIFDFDGPVCHVFAGRPAAGVAARMGRRLEEWQVPLYPGATPSDPMRILHDAGQALRATADAALVAELEDLLTREELIAVETATPTPGAAESARALAGSGKSLAVASNNAAKAIDHYLDLNRLAPCFGHHLHGRAADPALMKPHPDVVHRALESTGAKAADTLMIGDSPNDFSAADTLGVAFLGFARDHRKEASLRAAGARYVMPSWEPFLSVFGCA